MRRSARGPVLFAAAIAVLLASACTGGGSAPRGATTTLGVTERDFHISGPSHMPEGDVVLSVHNDGPDAHELIVVRTNAPGLPLRADGVTVDENALSSGIVGLLEPADAGATRILRLHLAPGRYEFFCNMYGHYLGGMHHVLVVR